MARSALENIILPGNERQIENVASGWLIQGVPDSNILEGERKIPEEVGQSILEEKHTHGCSAEHQPVKGDQYLSGDQGFLGWLLQIVHTS